VSTNAWVEVIHHSLRSPNGKLPLLFQRKMKFNWFGHVPRNITNLQFLMILSSKFHM